MPQNEVVPATGVGSVTATDTSIVVAGTATAPTVATGTLDVIATDHPPAANWSNNAKKITALANGTAATDAAAFGQIPTAAYATYTPTWTASGTAPAIGNAAINAARWTQVGSLVHCYGRITFGTTSTFGTGSYSFALPVTASVSATGGQLAGTAWLFHNSTSATVGVEAYLASTTTMALVFGATYLGTQTAVGQLAPWTWATSDNLAWNFLYEAA